MKIKDYKCRCEHNDFFFADKGNQKGIYCSYCGKWLKWADKDEQNLTLNQEPKTGHWIKKEDDTCWWYVCSECEQEPLKNRWNDDDVLSRFCPNCGAKMESEDMKCQN